MTNETGTKDSSPLTDSRLRLIYVAGIAINVIALTAAAQAGELLFAGTFVVIIAYLCVRYWMIARAQSTKR